MNALAATMPRIRAGFDGLNSIIPLSLIQLLARIGIAGTFFKSGLTKVDDTYAVTASAIELFRDEYQLPLISPELAAHIGAFFELTMPVFILSGLLTRLAALPLLGMTLTIEIFVYPDAWETHGTWGALLLLLIARGPGWISLDALIGLDRPRDRPAEG